MTGLALDGHVALVTGAGRGIGRAHARLLAERGAKVVCCDLGVALDGSGHDRSIADAVVDQIRAVGGTAVADSSGNYEITGIAIPCCTANADGGTGTFSVTASASGYFSNSAVVTITTGSVSRQLYFIRLC